MYSLKATDTIEFIHPLDPAIVWPDDEKEAEALGDKYAADFDAGLLKFEGTPMKWTLRPLTESQLSWTVAQSLDRESREINDSWFFHLALAGVVGIVDAPPDMPPPGFHTEGKRIRYLDPEWLEAINAPIDYVNTLGNAVLKISGRDKAAEKNLFSLSVKRR